MHNLLEALVPKTKIISKKKEAMFRNKINITNL